MLALAAFASGQSDPGLFGTVKPQIAVRVEEHATTADLVEVTVFESKYPPELLRKQVENLGSRLGSAPRGLQLFRYQMSPDNPSLTFLKASFATDGIIDRKSGVLRLEPILRAFAGGAEPHGLNAFAIVFNGETVNSNTIRRLVNDSLSAEARADSSPPVIEYRVVLRTRVPEQIEFAEKPAEQIDASSASVPQAGVSIVTYVAIGIAGLAAGALVYFALLRGPRTAR